MALSGALLPLDIVVRDVVEITDGGPRSPTTRAQSSHDPIPTAAQ